MTKSAAERREDNARRAAELAAQRESKIAARRTALVGIAAAAFGALVAIFAPIATEAILSAIQEPQAQEPQVQVPEPQPSCDDPLSLKLVEAVGAMATSAMKETLAGEPVVHAAANAIDGDSGTAWVEGVDAASVNPYGVGESLTITLPDGTDLALICVINGYAKSGDLYIKNARLRQVEVVTESGKVDTVIPDKPAEAYADYQELRFTPGPTDTVTLTIKTVNAGADANAQSRFFDTAVSELEFWAE